MSYEVDGWVPSPRHLLRVACIGDATADWEPGSVLEVGAGTGDITGRFVDRGFDVVAHDMGEESRRILRTRFNDQVRVVDRLSELAPASFRNLFAFEVLEHIQDDVGELKTWVSYLEPGGRVLVSVPAHQQKFGDADRAVGHVRRYESQALRALLADAGLEDIEVRNYGFPLGNMLRWAQTGLRAVTRNRASEPSAEGDRLNRTMSSGVETASPLNRVRRILRPGVMRPFSMLQRIAYSRDWSDGYVATATRPTA